MRRFILVLHRGIFTGLRGWELRKSGWLLREMDDPSSYYPDNIHLAIGVEDSL
ncbi:hypothetical protein [Chitinophaga sp. GbtcB8]|uniref:hypothetical protein n=1 Tax=Chitinophaga sp. GbtcB8 TaxID=2824753 RepID=UPI001C30202C|nr:hypothetical protein [Chitinophaga sp. GbtcB8]